MDDNFFMQRCLELAANAKRNGKTAVGSIIVKDNLIIAEGMEGESKVPPLLGHAEIIAVVKAVEMLNTKHLTDCILYTTVEPCFMCSFVIRETGIAKVVFGTKAGEIGGMHSIYPLLSTNDISRWPTPVHVNGGVLERECLQLLQK
jgi:tRNA(adenine34) deaminase